MRLRIAIIMLAAAAMLIGCGETVQQDDTETAAVSVVTQPVSQVDFPATVRLGGTLQGNRQATILAKVASTVTEVPVRIGQSVAKGTILVMLDPGGVQSQYHQAEAPYLNAQKQLKKMRSLYAAGAISETQLDGVETEFKVAQANFEAARQSVEIEAPFDGVVTDLPVRVGDEVSQGMALVEVADISALRLILDVPTAQVGRLAAGQPVTVASPVDDGAVMTGEIISVADAASRTTRSFEVECRFTDPPRGFSPGVYVLAEVEVEILEQALVVPNEALLYRTGEALVYAVDGDTTALIPVAIRARGQHRTAVSGDLQVNQRIVVIGHKKLTPGTRVEEAIR